MSEKSNLIVELTFSFSLKKIGFTELLESKKKFNMANQLFRCGTSIGADINEAQGAESKNDFRHKCKVAYKEAEETEYWLKLSKYAENYPYEGKACLLTSNQSKEYWGKLFRQQL